MRRTIIGMAAGLLAVVLLQAAGLWPFHGAEVRELLPVRSIAVRRDGDALLVETDNGLSGRGADWDAALREMAQNAPGRVFLAGAEVLFAADGVEPEQIIRAEALRPAIRIYRGAPPVALERAADWSRVQKRVCTRGELRAGKKTTIPEAGA